jgi:hypothetical protein
MPLCFGEIPPPASALELLSVLNSMSPANKSAVRAAKQPGG